MKAPTSYISRTRKIIKVSIIGIVANVVLAAFKAVVGIITGSIAITLDAVNNITDATSSIVTIVGTKLATKKPDRKHPFGHGRIEYLSSMLIAMIILYAGVTSLIEAIHKIIEPTLPEYNTFAIIVVAVAIIVKVVLGMYVTKSGKKLKSSALANSGKDALLDAIISASTLIAAIVFLCGGLSLEAYLGAVISLIIIRSGFQMLRESISSILGERAEITLVKKIKQTIASFDDVYGAYDVVLNNYGPEALSGSAHIEVPDSLTADKIDTLTRKITATVFEKHQVLLHAIGVYSTNTKDPKIVKVKSTVEQIIKNHSNILQMHGFYVDQDTDTVRFDIVVAFSEKSRDELYEKVKSELSEALPKYTFDITMDTDFSE
jgi:cation diffusion facilitator family transporter